MKILILGGTGNISSEVAACLVERGDTVTLCTSGRKPVPRRYEHIKTDRYDADGMREALGGLSFDCAVDFLAYEASQCEIAHNALKGRIGQYVFISSATVYQKPHIVLPITENMPLGNQYSEYARKKMGSEYYLQSVHSRDFPVTIVRPSHTFGKTWIPSPLHGSDWTIPARILAGKPVIVHDSGQSLWTLTASSDFASGLSGIIGNNNALGEAFNITSDEHLTWNAIYFEIGLALGQEVQIVHVPTAFLAECFPQAAEKLLGDKAQYGVFDNAKIKRFNPSWECKKSFRTAIRESVAWYNENESRRIADAKKDGQIDEIIKQWHNAR